MDPCDSHVAHFDSPEHASLGFMTWHGHVGSSVATPHQLRWRSLDLLCVFSLHFLCQMPAFEYTSPLVEFVGISP
jgi:hypothetical protein